MISLSPSSETRPKEIDHVSILSGQNLALRLLATHRPLREVFDALIATLESNSGRLARGCILLLDEEGRRLRHASAPSLPGHYHLAVDGIEIGPEVGTCGAAAFRNETVITPDIEADPRWTAFKHLSVALGLRAAWSLPIRNSTGSVLGTFVTYFDECREPTPLEQELVAVLAATAAIAIDQRTTEAALAENQAFLQGVMRASTDCIKVLDLEGRLQWMSETGRCLMEVTDFDAIKGSTWAGNWQDAAERACAENALALARTGSAQRFTGFCPTLGGTPKWWDVIVTAIREDDDPATAFLVVSRDISELKRTELTLREAKAELARTLDSTEERVHRRTRELAESNLRLSREVTARKASESQRLALEDRFTTLEEEERKRISRELHDQIGQQLTALGLGLKKLQPLLSVGGGEIVAELEHRLSTLEQEVHDVALALRPTALDDLGLSVALAHAVHRWGAQAGVAVEFHGAAFEGRRLPAHIETTAFRIAMEALNNVARHARATQVGVFLEDQVTQLLLVVADDGAGFVPESSPQDRLGLHGMRERASKAGGALYIESQPGQGTTISAKLPYVSGSHPAQTP